MIANAPAPVDYAAELVKLQKDLDAMHGQIDRNAAREKQLRQEQVDLYQSCNRIAEVQTPLYAQSKKLYKIFQISRYAGLGGAAGMGLPLGLMNVSPVAGLVAFAGVAVVLGAAFVGVNVTQKKLAVVAPQANSLYRQWEAGYARIQANDAQINALKSSSDTLLQRIHQQESNEEVLQLASGVAHTPRPNQTVNDDDADTLVIGSLTVPKRFDQGKWANT